MPKATGLAGIIEGSQRKWEEGLEGRRWLRVAEGAGVRGLRRYEASVPGSSLRLLLTMPSYFIVASMVLATRCAACFLPLGNVGLTPVTPVRSAI
ncbi:hypothetical protein BHE74_00043802 [Ensete ventricosum]|nr:hypothetical protein BHE74_00043802 [Ensete ventricosum]